MGVCACECYPVCVTVCVCIRVYFVEKAVQVWYIYY